MLHLHGRDHDQRLLGVDLVAWLARHLEHGAGHRRTHGAVAAAAAWSAAALRGLERVRAAVDAASQQRGRRLKFLVGKPGLDGHSNGAEQIAVRARDVGFEVIYQGIRLTPAEIVNAALEEGVHAVGLSILSGSHVPLVEEVLQRLAAEGLSEVPVVVGGIIPPEDGERLNAAGVAAVYTPKDYDLTEILADVVRVIEAAGQKAA